MQRENGPCGTGDPFFPFLKLAPYCDHRKKKFKCSVNFLVNILCLHLNLKCMSRMRQSVKIQNEKCYNLMALFCCSNKMTKCNDLIKSSF